MLKTRSALCINDVPGAGKNSGMSYYIASQEKRRIKNPPLL
jgi:hypothetical protein